MEPLCFRSETTVDAPPERLWPVLSNTDRLNRSLSLPAVTYTAPAKGEVVRGAATKLLGLFELRWDEQPFDWVEREHYTIERLYKTGPFLSFRGGLRFRPDGKTTRMLLSVEIEPRGLLGRLGAPHMARGFIEAAQELARKLEGEAGASVPDPLIVRKPRAGIDRDRLAALADRLAAGGQPAVFARLKDHLEMVDDVEAALMRPFELADQWGLDRVEVLRGFLRACRDGLLDLRWELLCPNCRVSKSSFKSLKDFHSTGHCEFCNIDFTGELDENVELRFAPHPSVRKVSPADFCIGGPGRSPHRVGQVRVGPGETRTVVLPLGPKRYFARGLVSGTRLALVPRAGPAARLAVGVEGGAVPAGSLDFAPGQVELDFKNSGAAPAWVAVESESWSDKAATAAFVTTLQDFRDLFSSEVLAPGISVAVRSMTILFTDLKGSTAMYESVGDARAYGVVRQHFDVLTEAARANNGSVVKTIGDAVMAAFTDPADAVAAALAMHAGILARNPTLPLPVVLKVGLHTGPSIVINADGALDYFGTAVNVAARVQSESRGGDIVLTRAVLSSARAAARLDAACGRSEDFEASLKGLSYAFQLRRFWPKTCIAAGLDK